MDGNGAQFVKMLWIGLDLGQTVDLKPYDRYRTFTKYDINNTETSAKIEGLDTHTANTGSFRIKGHICFFLQDCIF